MREFEVIGARACAGIRTTERGELAPVVDPSQERFADGRRWRRTRPAGGPRSGQMGASSEGNRFEQFALAPAGGDPPAASGQASLPAASPGVQRLLRAGRLAVASSAPRSAGGGDIRRQWGANGPLSSAAKGRESAARRYCCGFPGCALTLRSPSGPSGCRSKRLWGAVASRGVVQPRPVDPGDEGGHQIGDHLAGCAAPAQQPTAACGISAANRSRRRARGRSAAPSALADNSGSSTWTNQRRPV